MSDEEDAKRVNAAIAMIATNADRLITEIVEDAEACGLEASDPWIKNPLVGLQEFEVAEADPIDDKADFDHDQKLNS